MLEKIKYSLIMFLAGSFYGFVVPLVRTAQSKGYDTGDIMVTQYLVAAVLLAGICLIFSRKKVAIKDILKLMGVGVVAAGVSFCYYESLARLSSATSLTLLFQFVWMGLVVESVRTRTLPKPTMIFTVTMIVFGAVLATGMLDEGTSSESLDLVGILFGFMSAVFYTTFLVFSSRVAISLPAVNRSLFITLGSVLVSILSTPDYFTKPFILLDPLLGLAQGVVGICLPIVLIAISAPKLPASLTTIMASSELPSGVICAAIFLGESVSLSVGIGVVIVLLGIALSELESVRFHMLARKKADAPDANP